MKMKKASAFFIGIIMLFVSVAYAVGTTVDVNDVFRLGATTSSADKKIVFQKGLGSANPAIRVGSDGVVSVANDGTTFNQISDFSNTVRLTTDQSVAGAKNFSDTSSGTTIAKFNASTAAASGSQIGIVSTGAQTFAGSKTFSSAVAITPTTNQLILGTTNTTTINAAAPSANRVYTFPDVGADANTVMTQGTQSIAGLKTFSNLASFTAGINVTGGNAVVNSVTGTGTTCATTSSGLGNTFNANGLTGANRWLLTASFFGFYTNQNGTPLTPQVRIDVKDGAGGTIVAQRIFAVAIGNTSYPMSFSFSWVLPTPGTGSVYQFVATDVQEDGGSHTWINSALCPSVMAIQI